MLRVTVTGNDDAQYVLDLYENAPVNLNYQFSDLHDFGTPQGNYSQTFRIPATDVNKQFFGSAHLINQVSDDNGYVGNTWSSKKRIPAEITYRSILLSRGFLQFKSAYIMQRDLAEYEVVFFGESLDAVKAIGDKMMSDIDLSSYDHDPNLFNIQSSWNGTLHSGILRYGLVDRGWADMNWRAYNYNDDPFATVDLVSTSFTPFIRVSKLVELIFSAQGYTVVSTWLATQDTLYLPYMSNQQHLFGDYQTSKGYRAVGSNLVNNTNLTDLTQSGGYDYGNHFNIPTQLYQVPFDCRLQLQLEIDFSVSGSSDGFKRPVIKRNSNYEFVGASVDGGSSSNYTIDITIDATHLDYIEFDMIGTATGYTLNTVRVETLNIWRINDGYSNWLETNAPKQKQVDFIRSLQKTFNLIIVPDNNQPKTIYLEPWSTYIGSGTTKDWTDKIDYSKDVVVEPTTAMQRSRYEWQFTEANDLINKAVVEQNERTWGRHEVQDTGNHFAQGELVVKPNFVGYVTSFVPYSDVIAHRAITIEGKSIQDPKPRLAYWNGYYSPSNSIPVNSGGSSTSITQYGLMSPYSAYPAAFTDKSLTFGGDFVFHDGVDLPSTTLWTEFYRNMFTELYSVDARKTTAYFRLNASDINQFRWSDKIFVRDTYYRVHSIRAYAANDESSTQCELIKILEPKRDCEMQPLSVSTVGVVTFQDADGVSNSGTQFCCEYYGYNWTNGVCYLPHVDTDHGGGTGGSDDDVAVGLNLVSGLQSQVDTIQATTDLISVSAPIDLDTLETPDTSSNDLFQIFLEK